jgi:hypothetical protein
MASYDILREIVRSGANITFNTIPSHDLLRELVGAARQSGSHITLPSETSFQLIRELIVIAPKNLTFVDGK